MLSVPISNIILVWLTAKGDPLAYFVVAPVTNKTGCITFTTGVKIIFFFVTHDGAKISKIFNSRVDHFKCYKFKCYTSLKKAKG